MTVRPAALLLVLLAAPVAAPLSGCSGGAAVAASGAEAHARGMAEFERRRYARAIEHFRQALDFGRTSDVAAESQLFLARAYAGDGQHLAATTEFARFIGFYRTDPRVEEASFERIESYVALSPSWELDQTPTHEALRSIAEFQRLYPTSPRTAEAVALSVSLREKLARKQFETARLYERREQYQAAILAYQSVMADYSTSAFADDAAVGQLRSAVRFAEGSVAARQEERFREALRLYDQVVTLYPQSPLLREAEVLYDRAWSGLRATGADAPARTAAGR